MADAGQQLRELLADNLRELIDLDPRSEAEIMREAWPDADVKTAQKRMNRLLPKSRRPLGPGSWPRADAFARIAEVLGVQPFELILPRREGSVDRS